MQSNSLEEYKDMVVTYLRTLEAKSSAGDAYKLERLENISDADLLRKWLWLGTICGSLLFFLALPVIASLLAKILPFLLMEILWTFVKAGMGLVVIMGGLSIYLTIPHEDD
jgi:hypothetical protein